MCGIVGIVSDNADDLKYIDKILRTLKHRGPDDEGIYTSPPAALGHNRLSIIDLSKEANQPMSTHDHRFWVVYNGEIYNFLDIRRKLEKMGYHFETNSDTEVLLYSFKEWGIDSLKIFNGMFAFAIWDDLKKELIIARDRYGIKPVYYYKTDEIFIFASEVKAIISHPRVKKELDYEALYEYFTFQNIFTDKTFFKDIRILKPGHWLRVKLENGVIRIQVEEYWDFEFSIDHKIPKRSENEYVEELDYILKKAVKRHLISDVEIGAYLSGGLDTGAIVAIASKELPYSMKTFTCGFNTNSVSDIELAFDERDKAELVSYWLKTEHYEVVLKAGDMEKAMKDVVRHIEEPRVGQSYPNYYIAKLASKFVKVVLSGTGGDEIFGGYPWRYYVFKNCKNFEDFVEKYYRYWHRLLNPLELRNIFEPIWENVKHIDTYGIFKGILEKKHDRINSWEDCLNLSLYFEAKTFLHGLLVVEDKLSMAHGLEVRTPLLDNELVDFALTIPPVLRVNINKYITVDENDVETKYKFKRFNTGKLILRKVLQKYLPEEITQAYKQGFSPPDSTWYREDSSNYIKRIVFNDSSRIYEFLNPEMVKEIVIQHISGKANRRLFIWSILYFENWLREFL